MSLRALTLVTVMLCMALPGTALAQLPTTPSPAPPTLWSFLGIPQAMRRARDGFTNRRGNHPGMERTPPLKALADPANLESPVPEIKAAAEIKQAEDLAPQKIKAIKYLGEIGCGCYDVEGKVTDALVAALKDCTEDVRMAAVKAIADGAEGGCCSNCNQRSCCNEKIAKQLADMAFELRDDGCPMEPSERVRQAAAEALEACCPDYGPPIIEETNGGIETGPEPGGIEGVEGPAPLDSPTVPTPQEQGNPPLTPAPAGAVPEAPPAEPTDLQAPTARRPGGRDVPQTLDLATVEAALHRERNAGDNEDSVEADTNADSQAKVLVDEKRQLAQMRLPGDERVVPGLRLHVYRPEAGGYRRVGEMEVTKVIDGTATVRPLAGLDVREIIEGGIVVIP